MIDETTKRKGGTGSAGRGDMDARPKNWLVPMTLVTLGEGSSYGYELMDRLAALGFGETNPGTFYRTLRRMEGEGLCESEWDTSASGPARRVYSVTGAGEAYLDSWAEGCERYQRVVDHFFLTYAAR
ncbi:MAG: helix-turn-helix transcriptional regulator [Actinomycetota bacterium]|nr:helix-turn-helix transcriptional regulator [Actinomycetota bacterium]